MRSRALASHELQQSIEEQERDQVSNLYKKAMSDKKALAEKKARAEKRRNRDLERKQEEKNDKKKFDELVKAGKLNIRSLVLKQVADRTELEN